MKKVLITGAGSGLGRAAAIELSKRGHLVYATTYTEKQAYFLNMTAKHKNLSLKSFKLDIRNPKDREMVEDLDIDVLINNAAIGDSGSVSEVDVDRFRNTFETNLFSSIELTQIVLKKMISKGKGRIIFISSLAGKITIPFLSPYTATKFAIEAVAMSLRKEMKMMKQADIDVCMVEPGAYHTGFNQKNVSKQFTWMKNNSYFIKQLNKLKKKQYRYFEISEVKSPRSIVKQYVKAVEDKNTKSRYIAPLYQNIIIQISRLLDI